MGLWAVDLGTRKEVGAINSWGPLAVPPGRCCSDFRLEPQTGRFTIIDELEVAPGELIQVEISAGWGVIRRAGSRGNGDDARRRSRCQPPSWRGRASASSSQGTRSAVHTCMVGGKSCGRSRVPTVTSIWSGRRAVS